MELPILLASDIELSFDEHHMYLKCVSGENAQTYAMSHWRAKAFYEKLRTEIPKSHQAISVIQDS
ncbi:MAG: hypothetical protein V4682_00850 [Patescibacteria group bacterium]